MTAEQHTKKYGHFAKGGREYVITRPETPRPWFNYLFNDCYHALISQTGGGYSYFMDPKYYRILRYDHITTDRPGRYLFLKDKATGATWSANWQPMRQELEQWECRHGLGTTQITSTQHQVKSSITYVVPRQDPVEIWRVNLKNVGRHRRTIQAIPFADLICGDVALETHYRNIICLYNEASFDEKLQAITAFKHPFKNTHKPGVGFFAVSFDHKSFETRKETFLGRYGVYANPEGLSQGLSGSSVRGEDMIGAFLGEWTLKPDEEVEFVVVLGFTDQPDDIERILKTYRSVEAADRELEKVQSYWDEQVEQIKVKTPDPNMDLMLNIWGKYQLHAITHWRGTSHYHGAEGGLGYRDTAQDVEGLLALELDTAKEKLEKLLYYQYNSGHAVSGFSDIEGSWENQGVDGVIKKADVAVWLPYSVISYVKETGDVEFLKKEIKFHDGGSATVYEHILRAVRYIWSQRGEHGLPLIGHADWNDAYDHVGIKGKGESVWLAMGLARAALQMEELAAFLDDHFVEAEMKKMHASLTKIINESGWDGKWYLAAYNDEGRQIGSDKNTEGKVPLNSQTWAILSETVPPERLPKILDQIDNYLDTDFGPALFLPSYTSFNEGIGRVSAFAEGTKENAAVFSHACAFKIVADCVARRGDKAYETYAKLLPMSPAKKDHEKYKTEPYVWSEYVVGPGSKDRFGEGAFTWNTGTTPWMFVAVTDWILGIRREFDGLRVDPCFPKQWKEAWIRRPFRGAVYEIKIENPKGVMTGVEKLTVDGEDQATPLIPPHGDGKVHQVVVRMGSPKLTWKGAKGSSSKKSKRTEKISNR